MARCGLLAGVLVGLLAAGGCGSATPAPSTGPSGATAGVAGTKTGPGAPPTPPAQQRDIATIAVQSPARMTNGLIAPRYTCRGGNVSPPVSWVGVAPTAKEILVIVRTLVGPGRSLVNWAVAGIPPSAQGIAEGKLPAGAIVGRNSFGRVGYSLCPAKGAPLGLVVIAVNALPHKLGLPPGFDPAVVNSESIQPGVQWGSIFAYTRPFGRALR